MSKQPRLVLHAMIKTESATHQIWRLNSLGMIALMACVTVFLAQAGMAALTITNGNFDEGIPDQVHQADVAAPWYDFSSANFWENAWQISIDGISPNDTPVLALSAFAADETVDGAGLNGYAYQNIGTADGASEVTLLFDWGSFDDANGPRDLGITFSILESDGTFVPDDGLDILGASGVTLIDQQSATQVDVPISQMFSDKWTFDLSSAGTGDLFLRINNFETAAGAAGDESWVAVDNVRIAGPTLTLLVDEVTGETKIQNNTEASMTFNYYLIESDGGALNSTDAPAGWDSLNDQNFDTGLPADFDGDGVVDHDDVNKWQSDFSMNAGSDADHDGDSDGVDFLILQQQFGQVPGPGDGWVEAGGVDSTQLAELYLNDVTTLNPGEVISLGTAYNPAVLGSGNGDVIFSYASPGDLRLTEGEVVYVSGSITAVPEPASLALFGMGLVGLAVIGRRPKKNGASLCQSSAFLPEFGISLSLVIDRTMQEKKHRNNL